VRLSFDRWRQQLHTILALKWLSLEASVQSVAIDLGYESESSFVVMFRKALRTSPARYMMQWLVATRLLLGRHVTNHRRNVVLAPTHPTETTRLQRERYVNAT
jgi:AraC-like DNA-binding protein